MEQPRYEAEWGLLTCYDDLGKSRKPVLYAENKAASGGIIIKNLGGRKENSIIWDNVYSECGGEYEMELFYVPREDAMLEIIINGIPATILNASEVSKSDSPINKKVKIILNPGFNMISMTNSLSWAPDIDCFYCINYK